MLRRALLLTLLSLLLSAVATLTTVYLAAIRPRQRSWGIDPAESAKALPGDEVIADATVVDTRGITIAAPVARIWPWLVQMGYGRAGWYSYDAGAWHVVVLNANCGDVGCDKGSEQERWLRADLAAHQDDCTLAYWHQARFSSDRVHGNNNDTGAFWDALYDYGADLVLSAHAHDYERFAPQTPAGRADPGHGIREIVVGTGGGGHYKLGPARPNSQVRNNSAFGVLKLTLHAGSYDWQFLPVAGKTFRDSGHAVCHGRP